jgi:hypothetical protein
MKSYSILFVLAMLVVAGCGDYDAADDELAAMDQDYSEKSSDTPDAAPGAEDLPCQPHTGKPEKPDAPGSVIDLGLSMPGDLDSSGEDDPVIDPDDELTVEGDPVDVEAIEKEKPMKAMAGFLVDSAHEDEEESEGVDNRPDDEEYDVANPHEKPEKP